jgi:hypothetical protein
MPSERALQDLLTEAGTPYVDEDLVAPECRGVEDPADCDELETPESHLGRGRDGVNELSVGMQFHSRDVHLVMKPVQSGVPVHFTVTLDGHAPREAHGLDVDAAGNGVLDEPRMYQLIRQPRPIEQRAVDVSFPGGGAEAFG